jgi:DNA-binding IclR family transcriptional regulator
MPALRGASAKIQLSGMSVGQREAYVARMRAQLAPTPGVEWTEEELREAREQGWTTSSQEVNEGIWAVAAAIEFGGKMVASISVACPDFRMSAEDRDTVIRRARETAVDIARDLERGVGPEARTGSM